MTDHPNTSPPIACMLGAGDFKARLADITAMNARSLRSAKRDGLSLRLVYAKGAREDVQEMVKKEKACCAFLTFDIKERLTDILLTVTAPEEAREASETLFDQFSNKGACANACKCATS